MLKMNRIISILLILLLIPFIIVVALVFILLSIPFMLFGKKKKSSLFGGNIYTYSWGSGTKQEPADPMTPQVEIINPDVQQQPSKPSDDTNEGEYVDYEEVK